jgi:hypothetical protein
MTIADLLATQELQPITPNPSAALRLLEKAHSNLSAAQIVANAAPDAALTLAYDAARQAITGLMRAQGYRSRERGAHVIAIKYAREALGADHAQMIDSLDNLRRKRHSSEYGDVFSSEQESAWALGLAERVIAAVAEHIDHGEMP